MWKRHFWRLLNQDLWKTDGEELESKTKLFKVYDATDWTQVRTREGYILRNLKG
jgi:hypothetical protein